jgi:hypothetical protein
MYTLKNYKTKKELMSDLKAGAVIDTFQPGGLFPAKTEGSVCLEGPHYPLPHKWYATATLKDGKILTCK